MRLLLVLAVFLSGCALQPPKVWEKELLAKRSMQMGSDLLARRSLAQVHASKENASGGDALRGGGCGCN
jgi:hypothetical protein